MKLLTPLLALSLTSTPIQNSLIPKDSVNKSVQNKINKEKKEYYESVIKSFFPKMDSIKYTTDKKTWGIAEYWQKTQETDSLKTGDCEDKAFRIYALSKEKGLDVELVWGRYHSNSVIDHVWNEYEIGDTTYIIETASRNAKIIKKDTIDTKRSYLTLYMTESSLNKIKNYEKRSGLELKFKNKIKHQ